MKSLHPRASRLTAAAATAVLALGIGAPVAVGLGDGVTLADDGANPAQSTATSTPTATAPLTISPTSGGANTSVTVRSSCSPSGPATSDAFQQSITLQQSGNQWVGTGRIRSSGLTVGRTYTVTVRCTDGVTLSTSFTYTATPTGGASAGFGGAVGGAGGGSTAATVLAVGGGLAIAGTVGYAFLSRRRRVGGHY
ncbi:hypothetical protein [Streptomyces sp. NBC_01803]|uniref:hypothetical protein n=1 Tax=Streptomyces sp. NBC_01803 TaxID=2975946 RepID=UPI002DDB2963|nr:hypothetical protein [Streptomyces sp. NBC_01803]WSA45070.1 hypothetical protein OIE51_13140 [Streptomyces sp. NBC_01803]